MSEKFKIVKNYKEGEKPYLYIREEEPLIIKIAVDQAWKKLSLLKKKDEKGNIIVCVKVKK